MRKSASLEGNDLLSNLYNSILERLGI